MTWPIQVDAIDDAYASFFSYDEETDHAFYGVNYQKDAEPWDGWKIFCVKDGGDPIDITEHLKDILGLASLNTVEAILFYTQEVAQ